MERKENSILLRGTAAEAPVLSHRSRGLDFYRFPLEVPRLSGPSHLRPRSSSRVSPVLISSADLRHFSATSAFCRRRSPGKVKTCNGA